MTCTTLTTAPGFADLDDEDFAPLDVKVVLAVHPFGKLQCSTGDGCGDTCSNGASSCNSSAEYPA